MKKKDNNSDEKSLNVDELLKKLEEISSNMEIETQEKEKMEKAHANGEEIANQINKMIDGLPFVLVVCSCSTKNIGVIARTNKDMFIENLETAISRFKNKINKQ